MELLDPVQQAAPHGDTLSAHYEVRRLLGEGGFGHVYEAWDAKLCRSVALKRLKQHADMLHPEKLLNEARLAASLRHPAFVRIFSIDGDGKSQSIVMELVEGQTLGKSCTPRPCRSTPRSTSPGRSPMRWTKRTPWTWCMAT